MPRYFIEVAYVGTRYSGFQVQKNANTIQAEVTRALKIIFDKEFELTGSSRTDAGVHALQNYFHVDVEDGIFGKSSVYNLNAVLPHDIAIKKIFQTKPDAHCRFDATSRTYHYNITRFKDPFYFERAYYYPFAISKEILNEMASAITSFTDFNSFSKKHTQVKSFTCSIESSQWFFENNLWRFEIKGDRFLRGMVKGLVGTMLKLAKTNKTVPELIKIFESKDCLQADFSPASSGLVLTSISFKDEILLP